MNTPTESLTPPPNPSPPPRPNKGGLIAYLICTSLLFLLAGLSAIVPSLMSVMAYDGVTASTPFSQRLIIHILVFSMLSFAPVCLLSVTLSWVAFAVRKYTWAWGATLLPWVNALLVAVMAIFFW